MASTTDTMILMNIIIIAMDMNKQRGREVITMRNPADHRGVGAESVKPITEVQSMR